jgi:hypothetical protein
MIAKNKQEIKKKFKRLLANTDQVAIDAECVDSAEKIELVPQDEHSQKAANAIHKVPNEQKINLDLNLDQGCIYANYAAKRSILRAKNRYALL